MCDKLVSRLPLSPLLAINRIVVAPVPQDTVIAKHQMKPRNPSSTDNASTYPNDNNPYKVDDFDLPQLQQCLERVRSRPKERISPIFLLVSRLFKP